MPDECEYVYVENKITAGDPHAGSYFGQQIAVDGDVAVVGAFADDHAGAQSGAAYVLRRVDGAWGVEQRLTASNAAAGDRFGTSLAIEGNTIIVGADSGASGSTGAAYVFTYDGSTWSEQQILTASDTVAGDVFGQCIAIEGDNLVIGAKDSTTTSPYVGAAYYFTRSGGVWTEQQKLSVNDTPGASYASGLAIQGTTLIVGRSADQQSAVNAGSAYVYELSGGAWVFSRKFKQRILRLTHILAAPL